MNKCRGRIQLLYSATVEQVKLNLMMRSQPLSGFILQFVMIEKAGRSFRRVMMMIECGTVSSSRTMMDLSVMRIDDSKHGRSV